MPRSFAEIFYADYMDYLGGVDPETKVELPEWPALSDKMRGAIEAGADAVKRAACGIVESERV